MDHEANKHSPMVRTDVVYRWVIGLLATASIALSVLVLRNLFHERAAISTQVQTNRKDIAVVIDRLDGIHGDIRDIKNAVSVPNP